MKIGILTLPLHTNYGGILQAYALQTVLERMGHEVVVFDRILPEPSLPLWKCPFVYSKRLVNKLLGRKDDIVFLEQYVSKIKPIIQQNTNKFIKIYIHRISFKTFAKIPNANTFNAIIVGSDQVWRPIYFGEDHVDDAFLAFARSWNIKRIAYAASFGVDKWEYSPLQTETCKSLLHNFDAVSVREESGVKLCRECLECKAQLVLDPTMLLDKSDYVKIIKTSNIPKSKGNLLVYILDETPDKTALIKNIADKYNLKPFRVGSNTENIHAPLKDRIQPPVEEWLRGFYDAEFVVTDSFHACVFAILFEKQFVVIGNKKRGMSRFQTLLSMLGLEDRLIDDNINIDSLSYINYDVIVNKLSRLKEISISFLKTSLT